MTCSMNSELMCMEQSSKSPNLDKIVKKLQAKKTMTYTEIKKELGITDRAVSRNLTYLLDEGTIEFTKKGREKHYRLGKKASKILERKINIFSSHYDVFVTKDFLDLDISNEKELFEESGKKINALILFSCLKSIETGQDWLRAINPMIIKHSIFFELASVINKETDTELDVSLSDLASMQYFKKINSHIKKNNLESKLKKSYKILSKMYPKEMKALDESLKESEKYQ